MGVWAHPDDETFLSAGLMAAASRAGPRVICVSATCGEAGTHDEEQWPHKTLGVTRTKELHQALKILGVAEHHWLGYHDGSCKDIPKPAAVRALAEIIRQCQPDTI